MATMIVWTYNNSQIVNNEKHILYYLIGPIISNIVIIHDNYYIYGVHFIQIFIYHFHAFHDIIIVKIYEASKCCQIHLQ